MEFEKFGIAMPETTVGRELERFGFRKISFRPRHPDQNRDHIEDFKKISRGIG